MLRYGVSVDVNATYYTALHRATLHNHIDVVKLLLLKGADVNKQDLGRDNDAPLHNAARNNNTEVAWLLVNNGADINIRNNHNQTPLDVARNGSEVERLLWQLQQSEP